MNQYKNTPMLPWGALRCLILTSTNTPLPKSALFGVLFPPFNNIRSNMAAAPATKNTRRPDPSRGPAPPNPERKSNNVQVGRQRSNFVYADLTKHLLAGGEQEVEVSALGAVIADAVAVVEMLKNQGLVTVTKIETSRGKEESAHRKFADKIAIWVTKAPGFDEKYKQQMADREKK